MNSSHQQLRYLKEELNCSVTAEHTSSHVRLFSLAIPWCGRQLQWQVLIPIAQGAPDFIFDDDSFRPLTPPQPRTQPPRCAHAASVGVRRLHELLRAWAVDPYRMKALSGLVSEFLDAYRDHQVLRLEAAAASLPRLQFELSTLELAPGVQLEMLQQQACFAVPLSAVKLDRLLETIKLYGGHLPPEHDNALAPAGAAPSPSSAATAGSPQAPASVPTLTRAHEGLAVNSAAAAGGAGEGSPQLPGGDDVLETLDEQDVRQPHHRPADINQAGAEGISEAESGATSVPPPPLRCRPPESKSSLVLLATFRLPAVVGAPGTLRDLSGPELSLQLPPVLANLKAAALIPAGGPQPSGSRASASGATPSSFGISNPAAAATTAIPFGAAAVSASGPTVGGVPLVPPLLLPLWSSSDMCLAEYVPLAVERLNAQVEAHCNMLVARQQLLMHLSEILGSPLELNLAAGCCLFSLAWEGYPVLASLELGPKFPSEKPTVVLHCVRQLNSPDAVRTFRDYPWSPRWPPREMAARIHNWLQEELPNFMRGRMAA